MRDLLPQNSTQPIPLAVEPSLARLPLQKGCASASAIASYGAPPRLMLLLLPPWCSLPPSLFPCLLALCCHLQPLRRPNPTPRGGGGVLMPHAAWRAKYTSDPCARGRFSGPDPPGCCFGLKHSLRVAARIRSLRPQPAWFVLSCSRKR